MLFWWAIVISLSLFGWTSALQNLSLLEKNTSKGYVTYCPCMGKILLFLFFKN